jgi:hypothetical protein
MTQCKVGEIYEIDGDPTDINGHSISECHALIMGISRWNEDGTHVQIRTSTGLEVEIEEFLFLCNSTLVEATTDEERMKLNLLFS